MLTALHAVCLAVAGIALAGPQQTRPERGFVSLVSLDRWESMRGDAPGKGWTVEGDEIRYTPGAGGGDIRTKEDYQDFELRFDWKIEAGGNSGVFYRVSDKNPTTWATGPEYQVLDDERHPDGKNPKTRAGSNYALCAPTQSVVKKADEWNTARIVVRGDHVEHWLNEVKVVEYTLGSPEWTALVKESKFANVPEYGKMKTGRLVLQDHGNAVAFRNVRVKRLG
ncbi:MAG: DUF1080 domain-containing protein [Fimbriimonadaceae bacterium]|nr:DUF1080 domain-containing protein [Fimbriimonadaceae bacterium]